jgi:hypothetical protein
LETLNLLSPELMEKGLVAGAFIYLLHFTVGKSAQIMRDIATSLNQVVETLNKMDLRMGNVEQRIDKLENK